MYRNLLVLTMVLAGCAGTGDTRPGEGDPTTSPLRIEVTAEPAELERGGQLEIRMIITNVSDQPVVKRFSSGCIYGFSLRDLDGSIVAPPPPICTMNVPVVEYQPGEVVTSEFSWVWDDPAVAPGVLELYAGFGPRGEYESGPPVTVRLR